MQLRSPVFVSGMLLVLVAQAASAQQVLRPAEPVKVAQSGDDRCRKDVRDYLSTIKFVRESAGAQIGDRVAGGYASEAEVEKVVADQGWCPAAQLLRDKRAPR